VTHCPRCAASLVPGGRFCGECGAAVLDAGRPLDRSNSSPPGVLDGVLAGIGRLPYRDLLPLRAWWDDGAWRHGPAALFLLMALTPFGLLQATLNDPGVERAAVGFAVYFAVLWLVAIRQLVQPEPLGWLLFTAVVAFTTIAGVAVAVAIEEEVGASAETLLGSIFTVGLPEEAAKALALLIFLRLGSGRWAPRTYLYAGAVSGLAFGAAEAVTYTSAYASVFGLGDGGLVVTLWRLFCGGLFHACMAGIVGFFIGLAAWYGKVRLQLVGFGLVVAGVLHGLYDYLADGWGGTALAALTVFAFVGYVRMGDRIGARLAEQMHS
jgi:RsiW-degrading membrane proteinase PrsW (M82 family)